MIPFNQLNLKEGTLQFRISVGNLFDLSISQVIIFNESVQGKSFCLYRDKYMGLNFIVDTEFSSYNISSLSIEKFLHITLTWKQENEKVNPKIYVNGKIGYE
jgi:hypothetical protein